MYIFHSDDIFCCMVLVDRCFIMFISYIDLFTDIYVICVVVGVFYLYLSNVYPIQESPLSARGIPFMSLLTILKLWCLF